MISRFPQSGKSKWLERLRRLQRSHREQLLVSVLLLSAFLGMGGYILASLYGAAGLRESNALHRSAMLADLYTKIIKKDLDDSEKLLDSFVNRFFLDTIKLSPEGRKQLYNYCDISPRLDAVAIVDNAGKCLYTTDEAFATALKSSFLSQKVHSANEQIGYLPPIENLKNTMTFFRPIPKQGKPQGYFVSSFRPEGLSLWLLDFQITGTQVHVVRRDGSIIVSTLHDPQIQPFSPEMEALRQARLGHTGALAHQGPFANKFAFIGYAPIPETQWYLMVMQTELDAYTESDFPVLHLTQAAAPFLFLLPLIAWVTLNLYHRQARQAQALAFSNEKLHLADQAKSELLANVSHDLKTPLASLQLVVTSLRKQQNEQWIDVIPLMEQELSRLSGKVRNLLDMSRLESTTVAETGDICDLYEVVGEALERVRPLLLNHQIDAQFSEEALLVLGKQEPLITVLINLLENAGKYAPPGSVIQIQGQQQSEHFLSLTVRDFGPGVPQELQERIFEKFYRAPGQRTHGTGLGLAICRTIVEAHLGKITVESPPGGGAAFTITLPMYPLA